MLLIQRIQRFVYVNSVSILFCLICYHSGIKLVAIPVVDQYNITLENETDLHTTMFNVNTHDDLSIVLGDKRSTRPRPLPPSTKGPQPNPEPNPTQAPDYKTLLIDCEKAAAEKYKKKEGPKKLLDCCVGVDSCKCIDTKCKDPNNAKKFAQCSRPCAYDPECNKQDLKSCGSLKTNPASYMLILIILGVIVMLIIAGVTVMVCYKKFRPKKSDEKGKTSFTLGPKLNVSSRAGSGKNKKKSKKPKKSKKSSAANSKMSLKSNRTKKSSMNLSKTHNGSFKSRTPKATTPSKATSSMTKPKSSQKVSRSTLQRAVM